MEENKSQVTDIKRNTIISTLSLFFQSGYSAFLGLVANLALTILLTPAIFGIYITVLSMISLLNYFSDIGLAASLIQKKELTDDDVKTTFTVQQLLITTIIIVAFLLSPFISSFYKLPEEGMYLYWALLISFFLSSLKTIPSVFLERKIQFQKIVLVQAVENTFFYISVIVLAYMGLGLTSFTISVLLRAIIGLITIYSISFWKPQIGISVPSLKKLLSFGLPFQASSFLALFKDDLIILFLGKIIGFEGVGYIGWAKKWAEAPIRIIMDNISRVIFPLIARLQNDKEKTASLIEKVLYYQSALVAPALTGSFLLMDNMVQIVPRYAKWEPALPLFYLFVISSFIISFCAPFMNLFNALGKVKISFSLMLFWTSLTWILTPLLSNYFGLYGFPVTHVIVSSSYVVAIFIAKRFIQFNFLSSIYPFVVSAFLMGLVIYTVENFIAIDSIPSTVSMILAGGLIYLVSLRIFRINIIEQLKSFKESAKKQVI